MRLNRKCVERRCLVLTERSAGSSGLGAAATDLMVNTEGLSAPLMYVDYTYGICVRAMCVQIHASLYILYAFIYAYNLHT